MIVFCVFHGSYSDRYLLKVFLNKENAKRFMMDENLDYNKYFSNPQLVIEGNKMYFGDMDIEEHEVF